MSRAACNAWDFQIVASPTNKTQISIIDANFPGFDKANENLLNMNQIRDKFDNDDDNEYYSFSSLDSNSILRGIDFSVSLPDAIATQIMMDPLDTNVSRDDEKFYQRTFLNQQTGITVSEPLNKLVARTSGSTDKIGNQSPKNNKNEAPNYVQPLNNDLYYPVEVDNGDKRITIRLVEPNDEIVRSGIDTDNSAFNSVRFNGLVPGVTVNISLTGISGMKFMNVFDVKNLPYPYKPNAVFQVTNIKHSWTGNDWSTNVEAMVRPTPRMFIK
jgi:hypothetical protein